MISGGFKSEAESGREKWIFLCLSRSDLRGLFDSIAGSLDEDGLTVVEDSIQDGGGYCVVLVEDFRPVFVWFVGGDDGGGFFVAVTDDLEEEICSAFVDGQIAEFVEDEQIGDRVFFHLFFEGMAFLGGDQVIDRFYCVLEEHFVALLAGFIAEGCGEVGFADTYVSDEHDIGVLGYKAETGTLLDLHAIDFFGPVPVKLFECLNDGEAGLLDLSLDVSLHAALGLSFKESLEVVEVSVLIADGLLGHRAVILPDPAEF